MRLLFVKNTLVWPRSSGHDVHTYYMMKACAGLGHEIALATAKRLEPASVAGLTLNAAFTLLDENAPPVSGATVPVASTRLQRRFQNYWGVPDALLERLRGAVDTFRPDAAIVVGLEVLSYFPALTGTTRVWYAADEWFLHHVSQIRPGDPELRSNLRAAVVKALYERAHRHLVDRAWVVSRADQRAMRWLAGIRDVDVLPNGVDGEFFAPGSEAPAERTAVFWGRLDFGPNIQALEWFCRHVWPRIRRRVPDARFTIIGFQPTDAVRRLTNADGVSLMANLPDLRPEARRHAVVVLPFVSGAGIKNKLLEAAAMGLPIVCTPKTVRALRGRPPLLAASTPDAFAAAVTELWHDASRRRQLAADGRVWALEHHTWSAVAREAVSGLRAAERTRRPQPGDSARTQM